MSIRLLSSVNSEKWTPPDNASHWKNGGSKSSSKVGKHEDHGIEPSSSQIFNDHHSVRPVRRISIYWPDRFDRIDLNGSIWPSRLANWTLDNFWGVKKRAQTLSLAETLCITESAERERESKNSKLAQTKAHWPDSVERFTLKRLAMYLVSKVPQQNSMEFYSNPIEFAMHPLNPVSELDWIQLNSLCKFRVFNRNLTRSLRTKSAGFNAAL